MSRFAHRSPFRRAASAALVLMAVLGAAPPVHAQSAGSSATTVAADDPAGFIRQLGRAAAAIVADPSRGPAERKEALGQLLSAGIDVPAIGKFVLGRYWRTATPEQQRDYLDVFGRYLVTVYAGRLEGEGGHELEVTGIQPDGDTTLVHSRFVQTGDAPPVRLDWRVSRGDGGYRIVDVLVDDVSLAITQRSDFTGAIERNHGSLQALIDALKSKAASG